MILSNNLEKLLCQQLTVDSYFIVNNPCGAINSTLPRHISSTFRNLKILPCCKMLFASMRVLCCRECMLRSVCYVVGSAFCGMRVLCCRECMLRNACVILSGVHVAECVCYLVGSACCGMRALCCWGVHVAVAECVCYVVGSAFYSGRVRVLCCRDCVCYVVGECMLQWPSAYVMLSGVHFTVPECVCYVVGTACVMLSGLRVLCCRRRMLRWRSFTSLCDSTNTCVNCIVLNIYGWIVYIFYGHQSSGLVTKHWLSCSIRNKRMTLHLLSIRL